MLFETFLCCLGVRKYCLIEWFQSYTLDAFLSPTTCLTYYCFCPLPYNSIHCIFFDLKEPEEKKEEDVKVQTHFNILNLVFGK